MSSRWRVYTDGAAAAGAEAPRGARHPGGYAAVIEHGSDGFVVRGRETATTNTRMELMAVIRGLESVPAGADVSVHTDCSAVFVIRYRQERGTPVGLRRSGVRVRDFDLWERLAGEFARIELPGGHVSLVRIPPGGNPIHRRAHVIAGTEARAAAAGLPPDTTPLTKPERRELVRQYEKNRLRLLHRTAAAPTTIEDAFEAALNRRSRRRTA